MLQADVLMKKGKKEKKRKKIVSFGPFDPKADARFIRTQRGKNGVESTADVYDFKNPAMRTTYMSFRIKVPKILSLVGFFFFCS